MFAICSCHSIKNNHSDSLWRGLRMEVEWSPLDHKWHDAKYSEYNECVARFLKSTVCNPFPPVLRVISIHVSLQKSASKNQAQNANCWSNWWKGLKFNVVFYPITHISIPNQSIEEKMENRSEREDINHGNVEMNLYPDRNFSFPQLCRR